MNRWELKPLVSVGQIEFGKEREKVRQLFSGKYREFKKSKFSKNTADDYGNFHVFYTVDNKVEAVEIFENIEIILDGEIIFPVSISKTKEVLSGLKEEEGSFIHLEASIGIYAPSGEAESILVGSKGYYE